MRHRLLILITCLLFFLLAGLKQNRKEETVIRSTQQSMMISMEDMNNVYTYDDTFLMELPQNGKISRMCSYHYDDFKSHEIVGILFYEANMTNFAPNGNDKCTRSNG